MMALTVSMPSVTRPNTQYPQPLGVGLEWLRKSLSLTLMKNCDDAEWGSEVRAMAMVPLSLRRPLLASFLIGASVDFCFMSRSKPPPWIMKPLMTRWKIVPA